jgi:phosphoribosylglycinamide formyltransferase-1
MKKQRLAIFASGNGSNAVRLIDYFQNHDSIEVATILTNNKNAGVIERVKNSGIKTVVIDNEQAKEGDFLAKLMRSNNIDFIVLAGYLRKIPNTFISAYQDKILNIHPALLPKFGGKGMYGMHVHQAVKDAGETESGITIHLVNQNYDEGKILAQHKTNVLPTDDTINIQQKVQQLEYEWFPLEVEKYIKEIKK